MKRVNLDERLDADKVQEGGEGGELRIGVGSGSDTFYATLCA